MKWDKISVSGGCLFLGMSAFCFFDAGSKVYGVLILLFKIMWGIWFVLYLMAFIIYASRK
jgi:hypothetical protein